MPDTQSHISHDPSHEKADDLASLPRDRRWLSPIADERSIDLCECTMDIMAALFDVSGSDLRRPGRSTTSISRVRQIGMYVAHVVLRLNMSEVGRGFGRDRTTVQHACHLIEDMRDDPDFDGVVLTAERVATAALRGREEACR